MALDLLGKTVFVTGGSTGLGKAIAERVAELGAHVTIFSRRADVLEQARQQVQSAAARQTQTIAAASLDLTDPQQVAAVFEAQAGLPDILYCVAGGCAGEMGFLADLSTEQLDRSHRRNYNSSLYAAHALLRLWLAHDRKLDGLGEESPGGAPKTRSIVFVNSAASLACVPGYAAYTPAKCAQRGLADTLRQEAAVYSGPRSRYAVHCAFPGNFVTDSFLEEQETKPDVTKRIEGSAGSRDEMRARFLASGCVARRIVEGVARGDFAICTDLETGVLWVNMMGPSPRRGWGVVDSALGLVTLPAMWPALRWLWDRICSVEVWQERVESGVSGG